MLATRMLDRQPVAPDQIRKLRRVEFQRLAEAGDFADERVELLRGEIVVMSPQGLVHAKAAGRIAKLLNAQLGPAWLAMTHSGLALWEDSRPEPDVAVVPNQGAVDEEITHAILVVEVAQTSLRKDATVKLGLYAEHVPVYWLVDLERRAVRVYSEPRDGEYTRMEHRRPGDLLTLDGYPAVAIPVADILPPET